MSEQSVGHLCTRSIRGKVGDGVRDRILDVYERTLDLNEQITSRVALQYVFDIRVINVLFPHARARSIITMLDSRIDPFDVTLLAAPIAKNARIAGNRYAMVFGHLLSDAPSAKESSLSESYMSVVDVVPRVVDVARFSLIPRLSKHMGSDAKLRSTASAANMQLRKKAASNLQSEGVRNTPSFSSFYKLSTSWFGN